MSSHPFIYGIDFCFNATTPGSQDPEGHYTLGYGFISRQNANGAWSKVEGYSEPVTKNNAFGFQFFDLSGTINKIDFLTISFRPAPDSSAPAPHTSPFSDSDEKGLLEGKSLSSSGPMASCGCGSGGSTPSGNYFSAGQYVIKNTGDYEMTIEMTVTRSDGTVLDFKCDPEMQVKT